MQTDDGDDASPQYLHVQSCSWISSQNPSQSEFLVPPEQCRQMGSPNPVLLANSSGWHIGSAVLLQATEGEDAFLAQVEQLWENDSDSYKMMKCRRF